MSMDEHKLATVSWDKTIAFWDIATGSYRFVNHRSYSYTVFRVCVLLYLNLYKWSLYIYMQIFVSSPDFIVHVQIKRTGKIRKSTRRLY